MGSGRMSKKPISKIIDQNYRFHQLLDQNERMSKLLKVFEESIDRMGPGTPQGQVMKDQAEGEVRQLAQVKLVRFLLFLDTCTFIFKKLFQTSVFWTFVFWPFGPDPFKCLLQVAQVHRNLKLPLSSFCISVFQFWKLRQNRKIRRSDQKIQQK